jgi:hypothetical protein
VEEAEDIQIASPNPSSDSAESPLSIESSTFSEALINDLNDC